MSTALLILFMLMFDDYDDGGLVDQYLLPIANNRGIPFCAV